MPQILARPADGRLDIGARESLESLFVFGDGFEND